MRSSTDQVSVMLPNLRCHFASEISACTHMVALISISEVFWSRVTMKIRQTLAVTKSAAHTRYKNL